jgi:hypothetical protein
MGISFVHENDGVKGITKEQEGAVRWLITTQIMPNVASCRRLSTHYGVSFPRKTDPLKVDARAIAEDCNMIYWSGRKRD